MVMLTSVHIHCTAWSDLVAVWGLYLPPLQLLHYLYDVPTLLRHIWRNLFTLQGLLVLYKLHILFILLLLFLYLLSPLDLIPETVFGVLGLIDDVVVVLGVLVYISLIYAAHVANGGMWCVYAWHSPRVMQFSKVNFVQCIPCFYSFSNDSWMFM